MVGTLLRLLKRCILAVTMKNTYALRLATLTALLATAIFISDAFAQVSLPDAEVIFPGDLPRPAYPMEEPQIRVRLFKPTAPVALEATGDDYEVYASTTLYGILPKGDSATLTRHDGEYVFDSDALRFVGTEYIRLRPAHDPHAVFTLVNYTRKLSSKATNNYNIYRGALEYRLTKDGRTSDMINELSLRTMWPASLRHRTMEKRIYQSGPHCGAFVRLCDEGTREIPRSVFRCLPTTADQLYLGM